MVSDQNPFVDPAKGFFYFESIQRVSGIEKYFDLALVESKFYPFRNKISSENP